MKNQRLRQALVVLFGLTGALAFLYLVNCNGPKCCPNITEFTADHEWVCPAKCPGGGTVTINYTVEFWKEKERCQPPENFKILIKNTTDNLELPPLKWDNPQVGVYTGSLTIHVTKDTTYALLATGEQECGGASKELTINVVDKGDSQVIHFHGKFDPPRLTALEFNTNTFSPGIKISGTTIDNINGLTPQIQRFGLNVSHNKHTDASRFPGDPKPSSSFKGEDPNGTWLIEVPLSGNYQAFCDAFDQLPDDQREIRLIIFLECDCG